MTQPEVVAGDIVSHTDVCQREGRMLQRGMNFRVSPQHSVILMSQRKGAPYQDRVLENGRILIYEGHDIARVRGIRDPKKFDQPELTPGGKFTENGKFQKAALDYKNGTAPAELVRVYEKIKEGIWTYNGVFRLVDAYQESSGKRKVFKFRLELTDDEVSAVTVKSDLPHNRLIPSAIKREVFTRDKGQCVECGAKDNLHFDHDFPFSKGGTSISAANIRLLCMRHNLAKAAKIQ